MMTEVGELALKSKDLNDISTYHRLAQSEQRFEQCVERCYCVFLAVLTLQSPPVEADVPIRELVNQVEQTWDDSVESVRSHLFPHEADKRLTPCQDPAVHNVR